MKKLEIVEQTRDRKVLVQAQTTACDWRENFENCENTCDNSPVKSD